MQNLAPERDNVPMPVDPDIGAAIESCSKSAADRAFVGCLSAAGVVGVALFFYFGFFAFMLVDYWNKWGLLEPYLDDRTSQILYVVYWPLLHLSLWLGLD